MRWALLLVFLLAGCGSTRPVDVWVGDPLTRRPYPNVAVEMTYDPWPRWPGWLAWLPSGAPEPTEATTGPTGSAVLPIEPHNGAMWLNVAGERFAFQAEYFDEGAVFRTPFLFVMTSPTIQPR